MKTREYWILKLLKVPFVGFESTWNSDVGCYGIWEPSHNNSEVETEFLAASMHVATFWVPPRQQVRVDGNLFGRPTRDLSELLTYIRARKWRYQLKEHEEKESNDEPAKQA